VSLLFNNFDPKNVEDAIAGLKKPYPPFFKRYFLSFLDFLDFLDFLAFLYLSLIFDARCGNLRDFGIIIYIKINKYNLL